MEAWFSAPYLYFLINETPDELAAIARDQLPPYETDILSAEIKIPNGTFIQEYVVPVGDPPPKCVIITFIY